MEVLDLAWIAGFFDGEGCVMIGKYETKLQCRITITNSRLGALEWI